ncbi:hypothetical protein GCM10010174_25380 [Kutzneria viridogrisea]|uniref:Uncharacterized membrane protein YhaH (DUF805 family) n=2 Tax=Kutzneria TaxID=43356 RepID=A0ABR6BQ94_9PSEU|nr:DUF6542 domain-containing protein [Kutzneria albida]AHH95925.1 putative secreted protein [Kutzneria albida DSM 43870]MBA8928875.1 uncharacterized membrane protein YhaH (DUF805 family) [Kutzneria viridogrisea]
MEELKGRATGLRWWVAVLLALGTTVLAAVLDNQVNHKLGPVFQCGYVAGCLLAVCLVRRRNLFGPVVQPPLVMAAVVLAMTAPGHGNGVGVVIAAGQSLVDSYWVLVGTTVGTLLIGTARALAGRRRSADPIAVPQQRRDEQHQTSGAE